MNIPLPLQNLTEHFRKSYHAVVRKSMVLLVFTAFLILLSTRLSAQLIVETFEGGSWGGLAATSTATLQSSYTNAVASSATAANQTITSWNGGAATSTTTVINSEAVGSAWTWGYFSASTVSSAVALGSYIRQLRSTTHGLTLADNSGYLITPIVSAGITTITFWMSNASGSNTGVYVGLNTNVTGTNSTVYPTNAINNRFTTSTAGGVYTQFPLQTSFFSNGTNAYPGSASSYQYTISGTATSVPGRVVFFADGSNSDFDYAIIDDITVYSAQPFTGTAQNIPGVIKPENYDLGGQGYSYNDNDVVNTGGQYRLGEGVDIENATGGDGTDAYDIGFSNSGEWMEYTVNVVTAGVYTVNARVANGGGGSQTFNLTLDGSNIVGGGNLTCPATGGWQTYTTVSATTPSLTTGLHKLRFNYVSGGMNLNYISFNAPYGGTAQSIPGLIKPENYDLGGQGAAYNDNDVANDGNAGYRTTEGVDIENATGDGTDPYDIGFTNGGEWMDYTVNVVTAGVYMVNARVATGSGSTQTFNLTLDGTNIVGGGNLTCPNTGGWQTYTTVSTTTPSLTTGLHKLRFNFVSGGMNLNYISFTSPYGGTAQSIPGTIKPENYDLGGQGAGYNDNDATNDGNAGYRTTEGVDIENATGDGTDPYDIGFTNSGEWMTYQVNVVTAGVYTLKARVATGSGSTQTFNLTLDGTNIVGGGNLTCPNTGGWQTYTTVSATTPTLTTGLHQLQWNFVSGGMNLNYMTFSLDGVWTGAVSSDWSVAGNWQSNVVPASTANVTIPNVTTLPVLSTNITVNNLTINTSATVGLNTHTLTVNGALSGAGKFIASSSASPSGLIFGGASTGTVFFTTTPGFLSTLTLNDGANITLGSSTEIVSTGTLTVGSSTGATLTSNGKLILNSDDNGSARVAQVPVLSGTSLSSIVGNTQVLTYIHSTSSAVSTARRAWRLLTAPITDLSASPTCTIYSSWQLGGVNVSGQGTMITAPAAIATGGSGNGMDAGINSNYSMYTWNVGTQKLVAVSNTKGGISGSTGSADNIGYFIFIRGDRTPNTVNLPWFATINNTTLTSSGPLQLGDQVFTSASGALSATANGLSLVGNPYACSIDFSELAGDKTGYATSYLNNITNRYYVWNSNLTGSQGVGGYVCIDDPGNTKTYTKSLGGSGSASAADLSIQSGEAFFVVTTATGASSITFKELTKNATNNFIYRPSEEQASGLPGASFRATLSLLNSDSTTNLTDGVVAQFNNAYCNCVDYIDAPKFTNVDEMFSLAREGKQLCIERRADINTNDTLFLNLKQMSQHAYRFNLYTTMPDHHGLGARLEDKYTGTKTPLNMVGSNVVDFTIDGNAASKDTARFMVVFGAVNIAPVYTGLTAIKAGNTIPVQWFLSNDQSIKNYALEKSTDGINYTTVYTTTANHTGTGYNWIDKDPVIGTNYYRVLSTNVLNEESYSSVVSVTIGSLEPSGITVYPNPVQNGQIGIAMNKMEAGVYSYRLSDDFGRGIQSGEFTHTGGNGTNKIPLIRTIIKGTYRLEIFSPHNIKTVTTIVID
jgi:hypothetical protein